MADAADRRAFHGREELGLGPAPPAQQVAALEMPPSIEVGQLRRSGELVPRAGQLAVVAAVDAVADQWTKLLRDRAVVLDGQIGNAAPRVEPVWRDDGL